MCVYESHRILGVRVRLSHFHLTTVGTYVIAVFHIPVDSSLSDSLPWSVAIPKIQGSVISMTDQTGVLNKYLREEIDHEGVYRKGPENPRRPLRLQSNQIPNLL